jgi:hypothetical protein
MHRRIFAALLAFALSLRLALAGEGETCVGQAVGGERAGMTTSASAMREMGMDVEQSAAAPIVDREHGSTPSDRQPSRIPCDRAPATTTCQLFASCAAGFVVVAVANATIEHDTPASPRVTTIASLSSRSIAPELPPPRA